MAQTKYTTKIVYAQKEAKEMLAIGVHAKDTDDDVPDTYVVASYSVDERTNELIVEMEAPPGP